MPKRTWTFYEKKYGLPRDAWTEQQLREIVKDCLGEPQRRGRPKSKHRLDSARVNYEALAFQVSERIKRGRQAGEKITIKDAVEAEMLDSVRLRNAPLIDQAQLLDGEAKSQVLREIVGEHKVAINLQTAYTEVRKILSHCKDKADF